MYAPNGEEIYICSKWWRNEYASNGGEIVCFQWWRIIMLQIVRMHVLCLATSL